MKKLSTLVVTFVAIVTIAYFVTGERVVTIGKTDYLNEAASDVRTEVVNMFNNEESLYTVAGNTLESFPFSFYVCDELKLMVETDFLKSLISCSVIEYNSGSIIVMKGDNIITLELGSSMARVNNQEKLELGAAVTEKDGKIYIPIDEIARYLNYRIDYHLPTGWVDMARLESDEKLLPSSYDMREFGRVSPVRDQGRYGTCWAFASLGAFESTLMPGNQSVYSTDHMSICNSYRLDQNKGGEHTMSIAYLAAWQGPVYEKDDPYGDGMSNPNLKAVKHLEEALVINDRDFETIKSAIFRYGGVETSLYSQMAYTDSYSSYYSSENCSYYYDGEESPNHDVVVVGWDDNYPKENFTVTPEGDGAFICKNSWGEDFGEDGFFYVSYYDVNICNKAVVYTRVGDADNYDHIYQSDLLGWIGQIGFGEEEAYLANVYTAGAGENLSAVSFYVTGKDTSFEVYVVRDFKDEESLKDREYITAGTMKYAGYYTVDFPEEIELNDGERFAVVVKIKTPGVKHPVAIEYNADERTANFDINDGEGYISLYGEIWHSAEKVENCNVCLKAFTRYRE